MTAGTKINLAARITSPTKESDPGSRRLEGEGLVPYSPFSRQFLKERDIVQQLLAVLA
jgi:hypothetical protein